MRILRALLVLSSTFSIKSLSVTTVTLAAGINFTMVKKQDGPKGTTKPKVATVKALMVGLEDVVFEFGTNMKPGEFQGYLDSLSGHLARALKNGGAAAAKAIRKFTHLTYRSPKSRVKMLQQSKRLSTNTSLKRRSRTKTRGKTRPVESSKNLKSIFPKV